MPRTRIVRRPMAKREPRCVWAWLEHILWAAHTPDRMVSIMRLVCMVLLWALGGAATGLVHNSGRPDETSLWQTPSRTGGQMEADATPVPPEAPVLKRPAEDESSTSPVAKK
jgi:hypothetical protein